MEARKRRGFSVLLWTARRRGCQRSAACNQLELPATRCLP